jgi:hypothetical protein
MRRVWISSLALIKDSREHHRERLWNSTCGGEILYGVYQRYKMNKTLGQIGYEAYAKYMFLVDHKGVILSSCVYDNIRDEVKEAWEEVAKAVVDAVCQHDIHLCEGVSWNYVQRHKEQS